MCLVAIAIGAHPQLPLVVLGNRDEFHDRPSAPADWWPDARWLLGGRDLRAGGSWLAVSRRGDFAVVTNQPGKAPPSSASPSRGQLVRAFLHGEADRHAFARRLRAERSRYAGFCLAFGSPAAVELVSEPPGDDGLLAPGTVTVITNAPPGQVWPKAAWLETELQACLRTARPDRDAMLALLSRQEALPGPASGLPAVALLPFVRGRVYGTRSSTLFVVNAAHEAEFVERRFGPGGHFTGESRFEFPLQEPG